MKREGEFLNLYSRVSSEIDKERLRPIEIHLIASGNLKELVDFAGSPRLYATDSKGDSPLHLAARTGNLAVCEMFIRSGADLQKRNDYQQTPADAALAEGRNMAAQFLYSLVEKSPTSEILAVDCATHGLGKTTESTEKEIELAIATPSRGGATGTIPGDLDNLLSFESEKSPEDFFIQSESETASGTFVALLGSGAIGDNEEGWDLDISSAQIEGEGIVSDASIVADDGAEYSFLKVRNRGRQSVKRTVVQTGTQLSVEPAICIAWAEEILGKGWCGFYDIEALAVLCKGNGDPADLCINIQRNLEAAGIDIVDQDTGQGAGLWSSKSDISVDDLVEAIEAALTRATRLPGTERFFMDKSGERLLLEPLVRAKQEIQLGILACETAVEIILGVLDSIRDGSRDPSSVSLRTIIPARPNHIETAEVFVAVETLRSWQANGRVMDGKLRREALMALETLDFSLAFHKEIVRSLDKGPASWEHVSRLDVQISLFEAATQHLISKHLPYVRRFAARNVAEGEELEDVFQVAFMGLQRSTRRYDPERGTRFVIYCALWMRQALMRWRADEGAAIRVPVHRHENITKLNSVLDRLDVRVDGVVSDNDLAVELEWTIDEVRQFRGIPREAEYPESIDDWDNLLPGQEDSYIFEQADTEKVVRDALAELPERQADVIRMRFGIGRDSEMTLEDIGQVYGLTRERIRQIEVKALTGLSHPSRQCHLRQLLGL
ncbi:sigma-70 family RNA polymerase sigma factor [Alcanivorax jadensis]|uniref:sigma-70 family RNA polymerase sigma factor n=1 Tax=Alcanivorax jadensis TaxID=64988 RepID=UPI0023566E0D|nr:sigma-70 family RNA polymerase sigma factor [Alcanivorax jadensis]